MRAENSAAAVPETYPPDVDALPFRAMLRELATRLAELVRRIQAQGPMEHPFKGLVITDVEVAGLLTEPGNAAAAELSWAPGGLLQATEQDRDSAALARLAEFQARMQLSAFEVDCVLVCLAPEVDRKFERIYAYLNDDVTQRYPTADLLLRLLAPPATRPRLQTLLAREARLSRFGILQATAESPANSTAPNTLRVADGMVRYLLDQGGVDSRLARTWYQDDYPALAQRLWPALPAAKELPTIVRTHLSNTTGSRLPLVAVISGRSGSGRSYLVQASCQQLGYGYIALDARALKRATDVERTLIAAFRDSVLQGAPVFLHHIDVWLDDVERSSELRLILERLMAELGWVLFLGVTPGSTVTQWFRGLRVIEHELAELNVGIRVGTWRGLLAEVPGLAANDADTLAESLAVKFRFNYGEIAATLHQTRNATHLPNTAAQWFETLHQRAAAVAAPRLGALACRIKTQHRLDDLVLSAGKREALCDIMRRVRYRRQVMEDWEFQRLLGRGRGLVALFCGLSGTGKTMAADVIANELSMPLYRVDLAGVVSKYIGETEKNLRALFEEADRCDAVLFFDEADALFGKRSEVKDAHDRYANIEINYLLQRIENFEGIAILATNMRHHLDGAFLRRIHVTVDFTLPGVIERRAIWVKSFPGSVPLAADIDFDFLAARFEMTGGTIRNAALGAAFLAAEQAVPVGMPQLVNAVQQELVKTGRRIQPSEFGEFATFLSRPTGAQLQGERAWRAV